MDSTFIEYQVAAHETAIYPQETALLYLTLGLTGEAGEIANKAKKAFRDHEGTLTQELRDGIVDEVGDCLWYLSELCGALGVTLSEVASQNILKLSKRQQKGTLKGSGDTR